MFVIVDILCRIKADISKTNVSSDSIQEKSIYLHGRSQVSVPISISTSSNPTVTVGAWVKPTISHEPTADARYIF